MGLIDIPQIIREEVRKNPEHDTLRFPNASRTSFIIAKNGQKIDWLESIKYSQRGVHSIYLRLGLKHVSEIDLDTSGSGVGEAVVKVIHHCCEF